MNEFIDKLGKLIDCETDYAARLVFLINCLSDKLEKVSNQYGKTFEETVNDVAPEIEKRFITLGMNERIIGMALDGETDEIVRGAKFMHGLNFLKTVFWRSFWQLNRNKR